MNPEADFEALALALGLALALASAFALWAGLAWRRARARLAERQAQGVSEALRAGALAREVDALRAQARASEQRWREVLDAVPGAVAVYDNQDRLVAFNREASLLVPFRGRDDCIGKGYEELLRRALADGELAEARGREEEWLALRLAARRRAVDQPVALAEDHPWTQSQIRRSASGYLVMSRLDLGSLVEQGLARERAHEQLMRVSTTDGLTGLANRRQFELSLQAEWQRSARSAGRISMLLIDIDHFRQYNKVYGHQAGDECLRQIGRILGLSAKRSGELVARFDGDAFAVLLPGLDAAEALRSAERCLEQIRAARIPHAGAPRAPWIACSVGIATRVAAPGESPGSLIEAARQSWVEVRQGALARPGTPATATAAPADGETARLG